MNKRTFSPYELTHLARHNRSSNMIRGSTPVEYYTGRAEFCGLELSVTPAVLIPRVETEGLVQLALNRISEKLLESPYSNIKILEVGTGSGAVIIAVAKQLHAAHKSFEVTASDVSEQALAIAAQNAERLLPCPITFIRSHLFAQIQGHFDLIIANLPYIPSSRIPELDPSVREHEPVLALDGGHDGFRLISQLLANADQHLLPQGTVLLELDSTHTQSFFRDHEQTFQIEFFNDCFERHRFARLDLL